jgi:hypothetical protein
MGSNFCYPKKLGPRSPIPDPGWEKIRIQDNLPVSATLVQSSFKKINFTKFRSQRTLNQQTNSNLGILVFFARLIHLIYSIFPRHSTVKQKP